ncbi:hypothetical protein ABPG73_006012 [Tetrahymena malaccensis]
MAIPDLCTDINQYFDNYQDQCLNCSKNCAICSSTNNCIQCMQDYYLNEQGQCISSCGISLLKGLNSYQCYNFSDINCLKYDQQNQCKVCRDGYILNDDGICKNILCSQYQGIYDTTIEKCSLDGFFLSDYSREQNDSTQIQDEFDFKYSSLKDDLNEQIVEIIILEILNHKIVIGRTLQYIVFYDYETMLAINLLDMEAPITQIIADQQQVKLYVLIQHCDNQSKFNDYVINTLVSIDLASYQKNLIAYLISTIQFNEDQEQVLVINKLQQYVDSLNQIHYRLGDQVFRDEFSGQKISTTNLQDLIYVIYSEEIQLWKQNQMIAQFSILKNIKYFIYDYCVIVVFEQQILVYLNSENGSQIQKQIFNAPFLSIVNTVNYHNNKIFVSTHYTIYALSYFQQDSNGLLLQPFTQSNYQIKIEKSIQSTLFYRDDNNKVSMLIILYDTEYLIIGYKDEQYIFFRDLIESDIFESMIIQQQLFIFADQSLYQINLSNLKKQQNDFQEIKKIAFENENLYVINQEDPLDCFKFQFITFTSKTKNECIIQFPDNPNYEGFCFTDVQIENNLIVFSNTGLYLTVFQYNCQLLNEQFSDIQSVQIINPNTLLIQDSSIKIMQLQNDSSNTFIDTNLQNISKYDLFKNLLVVCIEQNQDSQGNASPLIKLNLNSFVNFYPQQLNEISYQQAVSNFVIQINKQTLKYLDMSYPFLIYQSVTFYDEISDVESIQNSSTLLIVRFLNDKYNAVILDGHENTQISINKRIGNIMYYKNLILFMKYPYNQLYAYQASQHVNQNVFYKYQYSKIAQIVTNDIQQVFSESNTDIAKIQSLKDGSIKIFNKIWASNSQFTNIIENTYVYMSINIGISKSLFAVDTQSENLKETSDRISGFSVAIGNDYSYVGSDSINQIQIFKQQNAFVVFQLFNDKLQVIPLNIDLTSKRIFIDSELGILIITERISSQIYLLSYVGNFQLKGFQVDVVSDNLSYNNLKFNYNYHLSVLIFTQLDTVYLVDINNSFYQTQKLQLAPFNQYALAGSNNDKIIIMNNDIKYLTVYDSYSQNIQDKLLIDYDINLKNIENYQIIDFSQENLLICIRKTDYFILQLSPLKIISNIKLDNVKNILISDYYGMLLYTSLDQQIFIFCSKQQQFKFLKEDQLQINKIVFINERLLGIEIENLNQQQFLVYDQSQMTKIPFDQSNIFNQQIFNNLNSLYIMTMQDSLFAQFWKIYETKNVNEISYAIQIKQLALPCSSDTKIKVEKEYFYYICPFVAFIYDSNIMFVQSIKYKISSNITIYDITYLRNSIFIVQLSQDQLEIYEINYNFKNKIKSLTKIYNPIIYNYNVNQNSNGLIQLIIYGISDFNLFQASLNYQPQRFKYQIAKYQDENLGAVKILSFNDSYKHIVQQSLASSRIEVLRYQVYYQPPQIINQFPVMQDYIQSKDIVEIYAAAKGLINNQQNLLEISSAQFISSFFKNLKIASMNLFINLENIQKLNFNQFQQIQKLQLSNMTIQFSYSNGSICLHSYDELILNEITFKDQIITTQFILSNTTNVIINNMELKNITLQSDSSFFSIEGVSNLTVKNLTISESNFYQTMFYISNVKNIAVQNLVIKSNNFSQGLIIIKQCQNVLFKSIQVVNNTMKSSRNINNLLNPYLFNFYQVQNVQFNSSVFDGSTNLGFVNFTGLMINFQLLYSLQITNSNFTYSQQDIPVILVTYGQKTEITNMFVKQINSLKFIQISLVDQLTLTNLEFVQINLQSVQDIIENPIQYNLDLPLFNQYSSQQDLSDKYLLNLGGIDTTHLFNLQVSQCYNVALLNLNYFQVGLNTVQNSNIFQAQNIKITDTKSNNQEPAIHLGNKQSKILKFTANNLSFNSNIMNIISNKQLYVSQSEFTNIQLKNQSTLIYNQGIQLLQISDVIFQNIASIQYPPVLSIQYGDKINIKNCTFKLNKNIYLNSQSLTIDNQSILNLQGCKHLQIIDSIFRENTAFGDGGAIYLYQILNSLIQNASFVLNQASENSGGAIYASNSNIKIRVCIFKSNVSKKERGGAIYSQNSLIKIEITNIFHNIAYIGGGIYYNQINSLQIDKFSQIYENKGKFYGNNLGSYPKKLLKVNLQTKQVYNKIIIQNFQSGNYTKQPIYVQFFDEQNEMLNFNIADLKDQFSPSIKEELENYKISIANSSEIKNLTIILGQELLYIKTINLFQLNITAGNYFSTDFQLILFSQFFGQQLTIDLDLNFRKCKAGEVLYPKQGYISCDQCMPGTYSLIDPNLGKQSLFVQCQKCSNVYAKQCYSNQIILQDNYWRESKLTDTIYLCDMLGCSETAKIQINGCIQGYIGPLCNSCDYKGAIWGVNYAQKGKECYECGKTFQLYIFLAIIIGFYTSYIVFSVNSQIQSNILIIKIEYLRKMEILFLSKTKLRGSQTGIILKIFFHYLQVFSSSIDIYNQIPDVIGSLFKIGGDPSQITYTNLDCIYKDWYQAQGIYQVEIFRNSTKLKHILYLSTFFTILLLQNCQFLFAFARKLDLIIICLMIIFKDAGLMNMPFFRQE